MKNKAIPSKSSKDVNKGKKVETKKEPPSSTYLQQFKQKQELSKSNIDNSEIDKSTYIKGGINFDDLEDWNTLDNNDKVKGQDVRNINPIKQQEFPKAEIKISKPVTFNQNLNQNYNLGQNINPNMNMNQQYNYGNINPSEIKVNQHPVDIQQYQHMQPLNPSQPYRPPSNLRVTAVIVPDKESNNGNVVGNSKYNKEVVKVKEEVITDNFSVNTSHFTNRHDINNNIDKIDISHINEQFDKKNNLFSSSSDHPLIGSTKNIKSEKKLFFLSNCSLI